MTCVIASCFCDRGFEEHRLTLLDRCATKGDQREHETNGRCFALPKLHNLVDGALISIILWLDSAAVFRCATSSRSIQRFVMEGCKASQLLACQIGTMPIGIHSSSYVWLHSLADRRAVASYMECMNHVEVFETLHFQSYRDLEQLMEVIKVYKSEKWINGNRLFAGRMLLDAHDIVQDLMLSPPRMALRCSKPQTFCVTSGSKPLDVHVHLCLNQMSDGRFMFSFDVSVAGLETQDFDYLEMTISGCIVDKNPVVIHPYAGNGAIASCFPRAMYGVLPQEHAVIRKVLNAEPVVCVFGLIVLVMGVECIAFHGDAADFCAMCA
jgi:hypothetical protein